MRSLVANLGFGALLGIGCTVWSSPVHAAQAQLEAMRTFVDCLNRQIGAGNPADISSTLQCLPANCTMTLTMSGESAQPACAQGGCQLPRVILNCPGPPAFIPSYSLCPEGGTSDHLELGVVVSRRPNIRMAMAELKVPEGPYTPTRLQSFKSIVPDNKGCNACHDNGNPNAKDGALQQSIAIDTFGNFAGTELGPLVIDTNEPGRAVNPGPGITAQTLAQVCDCIDQAVNDDLNPLAAQFVLQRLCQGLLNYQQTRGWR